MGFPARQLRFVLAAVAVVAIAGCSPPPLQTDNPRIEVTPLKSYLPIQSQALMWLTGFEGDQRRLQTIDCYRVLYPSTGVRRETDAS